MRKSKANLSVIARRAAANGVQHVAPTTVSRNLAARVPDGTPDVTGQGPKNRKPRKAWAHKSPTGGRTLWADNPFYYSPIEVDRRWSA